MVLAHLVTGRYRDGSMDETYTTTKPASWLTRLTKLLRKRD